jgi:hypothetical protein
MENKLKGRRSPPYNKGILAAKKAAKRERAAHRTVDYCMLTTAQKIAKLDAKLGVGVGAVKQRAKLGAINE